MLHGSQPLGGGQLQLGACSHSSRSRWRASVRPSSSRRANHRGGPLIDRQHPHDLLMGWAKYHRTGAVTFLAGAALAGPRRSGHALHAPGIGAKTRRRRWGITISIPRTSRRGVDGWCRWAPTLEGSWFRGRAGRVRLNVARRGSILVGSRAVAPGSVAARCRAAFFTSRHGSAMRHPARRHRSSSRFALPRWPQRSPGAKPRDPRDPRSVPLEWNAGLHRTAPVRTRGSRGQDLLDLSFRIHQASSPFIAFHVAALTLGYVHDISEQNGAGGIGGAAFYHVPDNMLDLRHRPRFTFHPLSAAHPQFDGSRSLKCCYP
jgi:hypothetical protein